MKKSGAKKGELPKGTQILAVPEKMVVATCGVTERYCPGVDQAQVDQTYYYLFNYDPQNEENPVPEMTGDDLERKGTRQDFDSGPGRTNEPVVTMQFTDSGADKFGEITRTLVERGRSRASQLGLTDKVENDVANQQFAIVLDRVIKSAPTVDFDDNPGGIPGNNGAIITGVSINEAKDLAIVLRSGTLPFKLVTISQTNISATLGKDSLQEAKLAAIGGLIVVALFLLVLYRFLGVVAVVGLGIYVAFLYAAVLLLNVTLTLPGIAGLILTIGVAADANVVIFERIKEEVRAGKSVRAAIAGGYQKGFHTIIDANVVTCITALVLFLIATAGVKGFALMLLIGTLISVVTAVLATRAMLGLLAGFKWFEDPRFMGATATEIPKWQRIDVVTRRRLYLSLSVVAVLLSFVAIGVKGLNLGIDFKGGTQVTFDTPTPQLVETVRADARAINPELGKALIQGKGRETDEKFTSFRLRTESLTPEEGNELRTGLESELAGDALRREERLRELQPPDPSRRDRGGHRLVRADRPLRDDSLPVAVRRSHPAHAAERPPDRGGCLRDLRPGGDCFDGRRGADDPRLLGVRHDHRLRPRAREHQADAAVEHCDDRERLGLGSAEAVDRHLGDHAAPDRLAVHLRRRDAAGLRVRDHRRHLDRRSFDDLHRDAAAHPAHGAGSAVRAAQGSRGRGRARAGRRQAGAASTTGSSRRPGGRGWRARAGAVDSRLPRRSRLRASPRSCSPSRLRRATVAG